MGFGSRNCGHCSGAGTVRKWVSNNSLECTCSACGSSYTLSLLKIKKKLIYLDQNFLSEAYKKKSPEFLKRADRISTLSQKQLLICPYSDAHDKETHLFTGNEKALWDFIKKTSYGHRFKPRIKIETQQLINGYETFCGNEPNKTKLLLRDAIDPSIHDWHNSLRVEVDLSITTFIKPSTLRKSKEEFIKSIIKVLPHWRNSKSTLNDAYKLEIKTHANLLINTYLELSASRNIAQILESDTYGMMSLLLELEIGGKEVADRARNVKAFLMSEYFEKIPHINIAAGLWAILKQKIKMKQFLQTTNEENIMSLMSGIPADIEHLSVFAPYCDAIFTEKTMARYLTEWAQHTLGGYSFKIFSANNWADFDAYLDEIEHTISSDMKEELEIVYG